MDQKLKQRIQQTIAGFDQTVEELDKLEAIAKHCLQRKKERNQSR